tara:strand:+ start:30019 stop:31245 length:1227 start_codon:yes stop_codon:yes gene_type:complete
MSFLSKLLGREDRASTIKSDDPYIAEWFGVQGGIGGYVDPRKASGLAIAQACINIITTSLASVPQSLYRRQPNGGREKARDHPLYSVLHDAANETMTSFEARESLIASLLINGNAFARLQWNGRGQVTALYPLDPSMVAVERLRNGRLRYRVSNARGSVQNYLQDEILHLRYRLDRDGVMGLSPVQLARDTFNLALTQQDTACRQAGKSFRPEGALIFPNPLPGDKKDSALAKLGARIDSNESTSSVLVLDGGADWKSFSFSSKDSEFLDSRKLAALDICRLWAVPPTVVGILDHGTYSNVEMESRALVTRCLAPMAKRIEQAMNVALLPPSDREGLFIEYDLSGLLRGDVKARYEAYRIGREWGWLSPDEIRGWENMPKIKGGDEYLSPLNMTPLGERNQNEPGASG